MSSLRPRRRFAFLIHPLVNLQRLAVLTRTHRWGAVLGRREDGDLQDVRRVCTLRFEPPAGPRVEGVIVNVPLLPEPLLADQDRALSLMVKAVDRAGGGVDVVGLGSLLAVVAGRGRGLQEQIWQPVTTGATGTAWTATENAMAAARARGCWPGGPLAVLGGGGTVGEAVVRALRDRGAEDLRVEASGVRARRAERAGARVFSAPERTVRGCPVVVGASTRGGILDPAALDRNAVVVDVALPPTLAGPAPSDVQVLAGEALSLPPGYRRGGWGSVYHLVAGYGPFHLFACVVEPLLLALENRTRPLAQGPRLRPADIRAFGELARRHGFHPVLARGWRPIEPQRLAPHRSPKPPPLGGPPDGA